MEKKRNREQEDTTRKLKREAKGENFITYDFSDRWKEGLKKKFETKGYVFIREVIDRFSC